MACEAAVSTPVVIKQRKERIIREPIPIRAPSVYQGGVLADKVTRVEPITRWTTFDTTSGDMSLHYFHNVTFKTDAKKTLLGYVRYEGDQIKRTYRSLVFDDGDVCVGHPDRRYSLVVELTKKDYIGMSEYTDSIEPTSDPCVFTSKLNFYAPDALMQLPSSSSDNDLGIVQWFDDPNAPHNLCRDTKCNYTAIAATIHVAVQQMEDVKAQLTSFLHTSPHHNDAVDALLQSSASILTAANGVLSQSLRVYDQLTRFHSLNPPTCMSSSRPPDDEAHLVQVVDPTTTS
ncbi:hypothetical protein DYB37_004428 [Aphanomyces astaci]|uniref:Uncharacterized protein n=1 Tax=Aphanomyces astaci TaxID=112090 RepID=A0A3R6X4D5_APHAT|nr:hypothetical protein DYB37_004428 [Aphanomyces astaci]